MSDRNLADRIELARRRWNVLEHPFYQRWSAGELTRSELARYSGQYRHAVVAIADISEAIAERSDAPGIAEHAHEERGHVRLWDGFVDAVDGDVSAAPTPQTTSCVAEWTNAPDQIEGLARLYAIERSQPAISETKLVGLAAHYGIEGGEGTRYFSVHSTRDHEHAREALELLEAELGGSEEAADRAVAAAEAAYRANWELLDGV